jgi:hypothetical protein
VQKKQRFISDQRWDLIYFGKMLQYIDEEFFSYNKRFLSPSNYVIDNWSIEVKSGLEVRVNQGTDSLLLNTQRTDQEGLNWRLTTSDELSITLANNTVNYVEVQLAEDTCAPDIVAVWDALANPPNGQEISITADTVTRQNPTLVSNTTAFTGDDDKLPLAEVTTAGGVVTNITDARELFFHLESDYNFGAPRTDKGIGNLKEAYDALTTSIKEMKGTTNWYDPLGIIPFETIERVTFIVTEGGIISWERGVSNQVEWTSNLIIRAPSRSYNYVVTAQTVGGFLDDEILYVTMPAFGTTPAGPLTVNKVAKSSFVLNQYNFIIAYRSGSEIHFGNIWDSLRLESGESGVIGGRVGVADVTLNWGPGQDIAPIKEVEFDQEVWRFSATDKNVQKLFAYVKVPKGFNPGTPIYLNVAQYSESAINTQRLICKSYLVRVNTDAITAPIANQTSTGTALTNTVAYQYRKDSLHLTDSIGQIGIYAVSPDDLLILELQRHSTDTDTADVRFVPGATTIEFF